ncbi:MAG: type IV pilus assembly protein PilM [Gammaproteobacteria bacterium]|nr:type IV pilus assembly protein PilM [Gammaproteobacteria bacterium]
MALFKGRSCPPLGIDIGSASVKLVALSWRGGRCRVDGFAIEPLPAATADRGNISDAAIVGEAVRRAWREAGAKAKTAVLAVADSAVVTRTLLLDATLTGDELEAEVVLDAERSIPYPIDRVALDFVSLGACADDPALKRILLAACPREQVLAREAAASHAGLTAAAVEIESSAQHRAMQAAKGDETVVGMLTVGDDALRLAVWRRGESVFVKHEPMPMSLAHDDGPTPGATLDAASRLLDAYAAAMPADGVGRLRLAGGGAARAVFAAMTNAHFGMSVELADPFAGMAAHARVDKTALAEAAPALVTACGLGLWPGDDGP